MLYAQQEALEEDDLAQRYSIVRILRKYVNQQEEQCKEEKIVVEKADRDEWSGIEWNSISATSTHSMIQMSFPGKATALDPGWLWNNNLGRSIEECVGMINSGDTKGRVVWEAECTVNWGSLLGKSQGRKDTKQAPILLLTGATGFLGSGLLARLCEAVAQRDGGGLEIWCLVRVKCGDVDDKSDDRAPVKSPIKVIFA